MRENENEDVDKEFEVNKRAEHGHRMSTELERTVRHVRQEKRRRNEQGHDKTDQKGGGG